MNEGRHPAEIDAGISEEGKQPEDHADSPKNEPDTIRIGEETIRGYDDTGLRDQHQLVAEVADELTAKVAEDDKKGMEDTRRLIESVGDESESAQRLEQSASERLEDLQGRLSQFYDSRSVVTGNRESKRLRQDQRKLREQIQEMEQKIVTSKTAYEKASPWSYKYKGKLLGEQEEASKKMQELKAQAAKLDELIPKVTGAERVVRSTDEGKLIWERSKAQREVTPNG